MGLALCFLSSAQFALAQPAAAPIAIAPPTIQPSTTDPTLRTAYVLGAEDLLLVRVAEVPEIGQQPVRVDPAGEIRLPMIGTVRAAGMTLEQLEGELVTRLKVYLQEPAVSVTVTEFHSRPVSVVGAVQRAGILELKGAPTLIEVLSLAGGLSPDAGPTLRVARRAEWGTIPLPEAKVDPRTGFATVDIEAGPLLASAAPEKNITVRPHDVITVSKAEMVYVIGEVGRPGGVPVAGPSLSAMEAIAASGGVLRSASRSSLRVLRQKPGGGRTEIPVDLKRIIQNQEPDVQLVAGDILVVPDTPGKRALARTLEIAVAAGINVATWGLVR